MANKKEKTECIIMETVVGDCQNFEQDPESNPTEMIIVDSARRLMALGLSPQEIEEMDIKGSVARALCEFARLDCYESLTENSNECAVGVTIERINEQIAGLDLELKMLGLRKRALKRRMKTLQKLATSIHCDENKILTD